MQVQGYGGLRRECEIEDGDGAGAGADWGSAVATVKDFPETTKMGKKREGGELCSCICNSIMRKVGVWSYGSY